MELPAFLKSYNEFKQHIESVYGDMTPTDTGKAFASLVKDTLGCQEEFLGLEGHLNPKQSYDEGIDIFWKNPEDQKIEIACQSKFKIKNLDDFDNVISKFSSFEENSLLDSNVRQDTQLSILELNRVQPKYPSTKYVVATIWQLSTIIEKYKISKRPSVGFYEKLMQEGRIEIIDGEILYNLFFDAFQKEFSIPQEVRFKTEEKLINKANVYVGIISSADLIEIYKMSRSGIFFENVRDFLGLQKIEKDSALDVNNEIYKTACEEPSKMIERNNGITFKASSIEYQGEYVVLKNAGIINGCQTTLCIVKAKPSDDCFVPIKIVITEDEQNSADIARTANTQNRIDKINLELSDFIRPQLVRASLAETGIRIVEDELSNTAPFIANLISNKIIFNSDLRFLFIGLFSNSPRNIFHSDYASIRFSQLKETFLSTEDKKKLNSLLANLVMQVDKVFDKLRQDYTPNATNSPQKTSKEIVGKLFSRFLADRKGYKSYLIVVSIFYLLGIKEEKDIKSKKISDLFESIQDLSSNQNKKQQLEDALKTTFNSVCVSAINHFSSKNKNTDWKEFENEISQFLYQYISNTPLHCYYATYAFLSTNT